MNIYTYTAKANGKTVTKRSTDANIRHCVAVIVPSTGETTFHSWTSDIKIAQAVSAAVCGRYPNLETLICYVTGGE